MKTMEQEYGVIEEKQAQPKFPVRSLLRVPHQGASLIVTRNHFGPDYFEDNVAEMQKSYCYPDTWEIISFREPTTSETISAIVYQFTKLAKPEVLDPHWLQAGKAFKASEWVVVNPPRDRQGNLITDERTLKGFLNDVTKVNGIYRLSNGKLDGVKDCSFVPYESFARGVQSGADFARSGLARGLEYADGEKAQNLEVISAGENYPKGVNVRGFEPESKIRIVDLGFGSGLDRYWLCVDGNWDDFNAYAVGVLNKSAEGASPKN